MAKGYSIHFGINDYSKTKYQNLNNPINDATTMRDILRSQPNMMHNVALFNTAADMRAMVLSIILLSQKAQAGDFVTITYAGHGVAEKEEEIHTILSDPNSMEYQNFDEGLPIVRDRPIRGWTKTGGKDCFFLFSDGSKLVDDTFSLLLKLFAKDVRILVICDSCENATMVDSSPLPLPQKNLKRVQNFLVNTPFYKESTKNTHLIDKVNRLLEVLNEQAYYKAGILSMSAVSTFNSAMDKGIWDQTINNGLFTGALVRVWDNGNFKGNYYDFYDNIAAQVMDDMDTSEGYLNRTGQMATFLTDLAKKTIFKTFAQYRSSLFPYIHTEHADNVRGFLKQRPFSV